MILLAHPFGNANVRAVLRALHEADLLAKFITTLGWPERAAWTRVLPERLARQAGRRGYELPNEKIERFPGRELVRLLAGTTGLARSLENSRGWASTDRVWQRLDDLAARRLCELLQAGERIGAVYGYEDGACQLFENARVLGVRRVYELPIAYFESAQRILREEAQRYPDWEPTLGGTREPEAKLARKRRELELAQLVICPSDFVLESLPASARESKECIVVPFGSPAAN